MSANADKDAAAVDARITGMNDGIGPGDHDVAVVGEYFATDNQDCPYIHRAANDRHVLIDIAGTDEKQRRRGVRLPSTDVENRVQVTASKKRV